MRKTSYYRDTLIGPSGHEVTRGWSGNYGWTVSLAHGRLNATIWHYRAGRDNPSAVLLENAPDYVAAAIARAMGLGAPDGAE